MAAASCPTEPGDGDGGRSEVEILKTELGDAFSDLESQKRAFDKFLEKCKQLQEYFACRETRLSSREDTLSKREAELEKKLKCSCSETVKTQESTVKKKADLEHLEQQGKEKQKRADSSFTIPEKRDAEQSENSQETQPNNSTQVQNELPRTENDPAKEPTQSESITESTPSNADNSEIESTSDSTSTSAPSSSVPPPEDSNSKISKKLRIRLDLTESCKAMNFKELIKLLIQHRKEFPIIVTELPEALKSAPDPMTLVLNSLDGYPAGNNTENPSTEKFEKEHPNAFQRALVILLESTASIIPDLPAISESMRSQAKSISDNWMKYFSSKSTISALDSQAFLQLVSMFGIAKDYSSDELFKFVYFIARRKQSPALCRTLELTEQIPDFVDKLVKDGKHIEAVSFSYAFKIMDRIDPVKLLQDHLDQMTKNSNSVQKNLNNPGAGQIDSWAQELAALKLVVNCIKEFELESAFPSQPLMKRIEQLEQDKADRKRTSAVVKPQTKRLRGNSGSGNLNSNSGSAAMSPNSSPSNANTTGHSNPNSNCPSPKPPSPSNKGNSNKKPNYSKSSHNSSPSLSHVQMGSPYNPQGIPPGTFSPGAYTPSHPSFGVSLVYVPGSPSNYAVSSQGDYATVGGNYNYPAGNLATVSGTGTYVIPVDSMPFQSQVSLSFNNQMMPYHFNGSIPPSHVADVPSVYPSSYIN